VKPGNLPKSNALSKIWKHWIDEYFHFFFFGPDERGGTELSRDALLFASFPIIIKGLLGLASKPLMQGLPQRRFST
jgi:hypothetical protein